MQPNMTSLLLQMSLYFNACYLILVYPSELILLCYKGLTLPYPARNFWPELLLLLLLCLLDGIRIFFGMKGNLTQRKIPLLLSLGFLIPSFLGYLYFILWQTYVLRIELGIISIAYIGIGLHLILAFIVLWLVIRKSLSHL